MLHAKCILFSDKMAALIETVKKESGSLLEIWEIFKDFELQCFTTEEQSFKDFHVAWRMR